MRYIDIDILVLLKSPFSFLYFVIDVERKASTSHVYCVSPKEMCVYRTYYLYVYIYVLLHIGHLVGAYVRTWIDWAAPSTYGCWELTYYRGIAFTQMNRLQISLFASIFKLVFQIWNLAYSNILEHTHKSFRHLISSYFPFPCQIRSKEYASQTTI